MNYIRFGHVFVTIVVYRFSFFILKIEVNMEWVSSEVVRYDTACGGSLKSTFFHWMFQFIQQKQQQQSPAYETRYSVQELIEKQLFSGAFCSKLSKYDRFFERKPKFSSTPLSDMQSNSLALSNLTFLFSADMKLCAFWSLCGFSLRSFCMIHCMLCGDISSSVIPA